MTLAPSLLWAAAAAWNAAELDVAGNRLLQSGAGYEIRLTTRQRAERGTNNAVDQLLWIRDGNGKVTIGGRTVTAAAGDLVRIPRGAAFAIEPGQATMRAVEIRIKPLPAGAGPPEGIRPAPGRMGEIVTKAEIDATIARTEANAPLHTADNFTVNYVLFKGRVGPWEAHANCTDIYLLQTGAGVAQTGGVIENPKDASPGESRGTGVRGAVERPVAARGLLVIPRNVAHHMNPTSLPLAYVLIKVWSQ